MIEVLPQLSDIKDYQANSLPKNICRKTIIALTGIGFTIKAAATYVGCSVSMANRSLLRMEVSGVLDDLPRSGRPPLYPEEIELKLTGFYCQGQPLPGCRWTTRWAEASIKVNPELVGCAAQSPSKSTINRILKKNNLKPHLTKYFLHVTDPNFFPKMDHLIKLFMNPPKYLFFFDECPGIQILKRLTPDLRTEKTQKSLEEFEYIRNGTMDVLAFLNNADGKVFAECHSNHKSETFIGIFTRHVKKCQKNEQLHYVMDNLSTHTTYAFCKIVAELSDIPCPVEKELKKLETRVTWLKSPNKRVVIHFTPYHGSWLNRIENWFAILNSKVLKASFGSADDLKDTIESFVSKDWNETLAHPFSWTYDGKGLHEKVVARFTQMLVCSADQLETRTLTKQLKLMKNLFKEYFSEITKDTYLKFVDILRSKNTILSERISQEEGPLKKKNAQLALIDFMSFIEEDLYCSGKREIKHMPESSMA